MPVSVVAEVPLAGLAFGLPPGLDHVCHLPSLLLQFLEPLDVVVGGPTGEIEQIVGLVALRLEPVWAGRDVPVDQALES